jgi:SAM-dependent methyltransferase
MQTPRNERLDRAREVASLIYLGAEDQRVYMTQSMLISNILLNVYEQLRIQIPQDIQIADVGCGSLPYAAAYFALSDDPKIFAYDNNQALIEDASKRWDGFRREKKKKINIYFADASDPSMIPAVNGVRFDLTVFAHPQTLIPVDKEAFENDVNFDLMPDSGITEMVSKWLLRSDMVVLTFSSTDEASVIVNHFGKNVHLVGATPVQEGSLVDDRNSYVVVLLPHERSTQHPIIWNAKKTFGKSVFDELFHPDGTPKTYEELSKDQDNE